MAYTDKVNLNIPIPVHVVSSIVTVTGDVEVDISGDLVQLQSGTIVISQISGQTLQLQSGTTVQLPVTQVVKISGEFVEIVSGQTIQLPSTQVVQISGQGVFLPATQIVKISGEQVVVASGAVTSMLLPTSLLHGYTLVGALSGGIELASGAIQHVKVKNVSTSSHVWVGNAEGVNSGIGYLLTITAGDNVVDLNIDNLNRVYAISEISGGLLSWLGEVA